MSVAGWYPDPSGGPGQRYFNGKHWTDYRRSGPPPRKSHTARNLIIGLVSVVALGIVGAGLIAATGSSGDRGGSTASGSTHGARDGKFEFRVNNVSTSGYAGLPAPRGNWVVADVTVTNIGNEPQSFFVGNQKLIDADRRTYSADDMAALRINVDDTMVLDLGPGFAINVLLPFDIPTGASPAALQLHDSAFSGGVRVDVA
ncbi:DUF4352 domain-containing protein [Mycolicibacterium vaccae]|uniref:DUF4352 domain-containing protein n=1 Tax=Mycolicibacterium vaccae TaxID=1810 RepID=UPI003CE9CA60